MKPLSSLSYLNLVMMAKPVCDRAIYKTIRKNKFRSIVEVGLGDGSRADNVIRVSRKYAVSPSVRYTGVDMFDARTANPLPLIGMHRKLNSENVKAQLVPGDLASGIARIANSHVRTDLIIVSAGFEKEELEACWFYFPRMLHSGSVVLIQHEPACEFERYNRLQIEKLASSRSEQRPMAA